MWERDSPESTVLLATDMDGTVIPTDQDDRRLRETHVFAATMLSRPQITLAYVTGRSLALAREAIEAFGLPVPAFLACDVGTSVYKLTETGFRLDSQYRALMLEARGELTGDSIRARLGAVPGLTLQEDEKQAEFKISYYFPPGPRGEAVVVEARRRLALEARTRVAIVSSRKPGNGRGLLDVLPAGVAKDTAVHYLRRLTGVDGERVVVAGDSGNDRALFESGYRAIVVGNAPDALKADLRRHGARNARRDDLIYFARRPFASGVLEGCRHFGLL